MDQLITNRELLLVRHTAVAKQYQTVCYGASDVELSPAGKLHADQLANELAERPIARIIHSGLQRTRYLAERLADRLSLPLEEQPKFRERNFGSWELRPWEEIYNETGDDMLKMISEPDNFRPGGAETTREFSDRIQSAIAEIDPDGLTIVIAHGGPIAALRGMQQQKPIADWLTLIPAYGQCIPYPFSNGKG
jgi:broad specificity phosphatase PhoE